MPYSLDWFAAETLAKAGTKIRRVSWTDRWLQRQGALWLLAIGTTAPRVIKTTDFGADELNAREQALTKLPLPYSLA